MALSSPVLLVALRPSSQLGSEGDVDTGPHMADGDILFSGLGLYAIQINPERERDKAPNFGEIDFVTQSLNFYRRRYARFCFSFESKIQFGRISITVLTWIPTTLFINHSGKILVIISVKIVGLKVVIRFHIAMKLRTKILSNGICRVSNFACPAEARSQSSEAHPRIQDYEE